MAVALVARVIDTQANQSFDVTYERFPVRIGRNQLNDLPIDRPYVSQFHAAIEVRDKQIIAKDLGSTNGTYVNRGRRLLPGNAQALNEGDEVIVGKTFLRFHITQ